ncbi:MAG TPA: response regulator [Gemmata sp.]
MFATALTVYTFGLGLVPPTLTTAREVRALPAGAVRFVKLNGVVTFSPPSHDYFYLQDPSGGVRVEWAGGGRPPKPGDRAEVLGVAGPGAHLSKVQAVRARVTPGDRKSLPPPERFNLTTDEAHYLDGQWVAAEAVLQSASVPDQTWLKIDLGRGRGTVTAYLPLPAEGAKATARRGAVVRVRGVWQVGPRGAAPPHLLVTDWDEVEVVRPPDRPEALPLLTARALRQSRHDPIADRLPVRVCGVVTLSHPHKHLFLQDETGVVQVACSNRPEVLVGQRVTAVGFPRLGTAPARLEDAHVRVSDPTAGPLPAPHPATIAEALSGQLDGRVVSFTGRVLDSGPQGAWATATVLVDGVTFTAVFLDPEVVPEPGSRVEVVGVATREPLVALRPHTFAVVVRPGDLWVLEGPPVALPPLPAEPGGWTRRRGAFVCGALGGLCLLGGAGATLMRLQARRAAALALRERAARVRLEQQLKLAARLEAAGRLAGSVAHDFNNLLTVINGCAVLLEHEIGGGPHPEKVRAFAAAIRRAGEQAATLTRQLLAFSRQRTEAPYPLDLNEVLGSATDMLERLLGDRIAVRTAPGAGLPLVVAEPGLLLQVLLNLAVNAADAMPAGGTFTLATGAPEPGWVRLTLADTGTGMSDEVKARVFEAGFTTKPAGKGTGLGLATVYGIVRGLGGRIGFTSELGHGTSFEVDLRAAAAPALAPATVAIGLDATQLAHGPAPAVVLLVEDEEEVCALLRHVLEAAGYTVLASGAPDEALGLLAQHHGPLDLLVTDVVLPGLSGRQLADRVRGLRPTTKVLFMSGYTVDEIREQGVSEEQVDFLHKPFLPRELIERVSQMLAAPYP